MLVQSGAITPKLLGSVLEITNRLPMAVSITRNPCINRTPNQEVITATTSQIAPVILLVSLAVTATVSGPVTGPGDVMDIDARDFGS